MKTTKFRLLHSTDLSGDGTAARLTPLVTDRDRYSIMGHVKAPSFLAVSIPSVTAVVSYRRQVIFFFQNFVAQMVVSENHKQNESFNFFFSLNKNILSRTTTSFFASAIRRNKRLVVITQNCRCL
jgi:hypothetical protein